MQENAHEMEGGEKVDNYYVYSWTSCGFESDFPQPTTKTSSRRKTIGMPRKKEAKKDNNIIPSNTAHGKYKLTPHII